MRRRRRNRLNSKAQGPRGPKSPKALKHVLTEEALKGDMALIAKASEAARLNSESATRTPSDLQKDLRKHLQTKAVSTAARSYVPDTVKKAFEESQNAADNSAATED